MSAASYLNAIPSALIAVDRGLLVVFINQPAEMLLGVSAHYALGKPLGELPGLEARLGDLCESVFVACEPLSLFDHQVTLPLQESIGVTLHVTPVLEEAASGAALYAREVLITIERADGMNRLAASAWKQEATRAVGVMAAMLAHEVKNPLSGIRGAAQLLREEVDGEQQPLTELICSETDRISELLNQFEIFTMGAPEQRQAVNIHEALHYAKSIAQAGFARHVAFKERYDPSLPPVAGQRDLLVQLFLNLIKNAAEALDGQQDATITLVTAYRGGSRLRLGPDGDKVGLPVAVSIEDNGPGIPDAIRDHLFEPFVSSKADGRGLGLAIVAKLAADLGAVAELEPVAQIGTKFTVLLPLYSE